MSALQKIISAVETPPPDGSAAVEYKKGSHSTGEGDRYEERMQALVFLRCLRRGLLFQLSANNDDGGKFDDVVLVWRADGHAKACILLVQLKHKTSPKAMTIRRDTLLSSAPDSDFGLSKYCSSYRKISESLERNRAKFVLLTNACLGDSSLDMFESQNVDSISGLDLLHAGGDLYKLNPNNQDVWQAVDGNTSFMEHFYLLCKQRNSEEVVHDLHRELEELLGAGDLCGSICDSLFKSFREWMNKQSTCLTRDWSKWQAIVDEYIRKEVTMTSVVTTRLEYCSVADVRDYIWSSNPAWVRPPERGTEALSATKVHQAIAHNTHIMVPVKRYRLLRHKILRCWGPFCRWLVIVDDDRGGSANILSEVLTEIQTVADDLAVEGPKKLFHTERHLVIVSSRENNCFKDTFQPSNVSDGSWQECLDVIVRLNGDQYECHLRDLVSSVDGLKSLVDGEPALLLALTQVSQPVRLGRDLEPLPPYYICRKLLTRQVVREKVFWTLGNVREYAKEKLQAFRTANKTAVVEGIPGVGKSKMLSHVAEQIKEMDPACWLLRVNLFEFYTVLDHSKSGACAVESILKQTVFNKGQLGRLEYALIRHSLRESPRVVCLVDGFDEVCPDFVDICLNVLPMLEPRRGRLVVTTRPASARLLEDQLGVLAHSLEPFSKLELEKFFRHHPLSRDIPPISGFNKSMTNLLKIPLFAEMFADLSQEEADIYNIVTLYEAFFQNKFKRLYEEKYDEKLTTPRKRKEVKEAQKKHEEQLMNLAASVLWYNASLSEEVTFDREYFVKAGIVYEFADGKPAFLHRTFAEHFLAKWCFIGDGQSCRVAVYRKACTDGTLEFFVESFNRRAVMGRPLLEAILGGDENKMESLLAEGADPKQRDACGRNALHLAAAYSDRCPGGLLRRLCGGLEEGALSAEDGLLGWTPMRYAAEGGHFSALEELLDSGADLSHLGDFAPVRDNDNPTGLQVIFERSGYRALYKHVIEVKHPLLDDKAPTAQIEFAVSLIAANMPKKSLSLIAKEAAEQGHTIVSSLLLRGNERTS